MIRNGVMMLKMGRLQRRYINKQENAAKKLPFLDEMLAEVDLSGMRRALEVGCGPGYMSAALRDRLGVDVVGTDVDPAEIEFARRHSGGTVGLTFVEADSTALPFADGEFDLVLSMMVMHHIPNWRGALTEIVRVLRPGGSFLFHDLTYSWFLKAAFKPVMRSHAFYSIDEISGHLHKSGMQAIYASAPHKYLYDQFTEYNFVFVKK
jgi:ubiquinone/menaquinone biosynthesis C-methylase UbiE